MIELNFKKVSNSHDYNLIIFKYIFQSSNLTPFYEVLARSLPDERSDISKRSSASEEEPSDEIIRSIYLSSRD